MASQQTPCDRKNELNQQVYAEPMDVSTQEMCVEPIPVEDSEPVCKNFTWFVLFYNSSIKF